MVHSQLKKHRPLHNKYLLVLAGVFFLIFIAAYRQNNVNMIHLRDAVFKADQESGDTEAALKKLREYVYSHMNTNLSTKNGVKPPIQLKYRYERLAQAEKDRVTAVNGKIYTNAQNECERTNPEGLSGRGRVGCIQEYVNSHGIKENSIPDAQYKFDFVSPNWSPDLAGWSEVLAAAFLLLFIAQVLWQRRRG